MRLSKFLFPVMVLLVITACEPPAVTALPASEPVIYQADADDVFDTVVQAIGTAPALENSTGWLINSSDRAGGFISADTVVTAWTFFEGYVRTRERVSVVVSRQGEDRARVIVQGTSEALPLIERIEEYLLDQHEPL